MKKVAKKHPFGDLFSLTSFKKKQILRPFGPHAAPLGPITPAVGFNFFRKETNMCALVLGWACFNARMVGQIVVFLFIK